MKVQDYAFTSQLEKGDFIVCPYGYQFSSARYNGNYYDSFQQWPVDPFSEGFTLVKTIGDVKVYRFNN
jgi:hypothetical protein